MNCPQCGKQTKDHLTAPFCSSRCLSARLETITDVQILKKTSTNREAYLTKCVVEVEAQDEALALQEVKQAA
jgi:hypothetical protein